MEHLSYRALQAKCKEVDIKANQKRCVLLSLLKELEINPCVGNVIPTNPIATDITSDKKTSVTTEASTSPKTDTHLLEEVTPSTSTHDDALPPSNTNDLEDADTDHILPSPTVSTIMASQQDESVIISNDTTQYSVALPVDKELIHDALTSVVVSSHVTVLTSSDATTTTENRVIVQPELLPALNIDQTLPRVSFSKVCKTFKPKTGPVPPYGGDSLFSPKKKNVKTNLPSRSSRTAKTVPMLPKLKVTTRPNVANVYEINFAASSAAVSTASSSSSLSLATDDDVTVVAPVMTPKKLPPRQYVKTKGDAVDHHAARKKTFLDSVKKKARDSRQKSRQREEESDAPPTIQVMEFTPNASS